MRSESRADALSLSLLSDQPADEDQLNFAPYAQTLAEVIADGSTQTPLTIGVFGSWGSGKTSLMAMVKRRLDALRREGRRGGKRRRAEAAEVEHNLVVTRGQGAFGSRKSKRSRNSRKLFAFFVSFRAFRGPKLCRVWRMRYK